MPIPKPKTGEEKDKFVSRCMADSVMNKEYPDNKQRAAICYSQWKSKSMLDNDWLIDQIRGRKEKLTSFGRGITTADNYVKTLADAAGLDVCYKRLATRSISFDDILQKAARTLVYSNDEMELESKADSSHRFKEVMKGLPRDIKLPKNTLMLFVHKLTTSIEDRDKDILHSEGMELDPKMLLLWQHIHTMPIGKYLYTISQNDKSVRVLSAIVDINDTSHDAAVMVDNGMGRFSHGFKATEFEKRKSINGKETGGFEIHKAEVMEESLVSVPANPGAETEDVLLSLIEGGKLTSPIMKSIGQTLREKKPTMVPGITYREVNGKWGKEVTCASFDELKKMADIGILVGIKKEEENEDLSGTGTDENESGEAEDTTSSPEETDDDGDKVNNEEEKSASNKEMKAMSTYKCSSCGYKQQGNELLQNSICPECGGPMLKMGKEADTEEKSMYVNPSGSYEAISQKLNKAIRDTYGEKACISATFPDKVIFQKEWDGTYFSVNWQMSGDSIEFIGEPKKVKVDITKSFLNMETKQGRTISKSNETKIKDAREDIKEASRVEGLTRGCLALLNKAFNSLGEVLKSLGTEEEVTKEISIEEAKVVFLKNSTTDDRLQMQKLLEAMTVVDERKQTTKWFKSLKK